MEEFVKGKTKKIVVTGRKKDSGYDIRNLVKLMTLAVNCNFRYSAGVME